MATKGDLHFESKDFVHVPRNYYHQTICEGADSLKYLAFDSFSMGHNPNTPIRDSLAKVVFKMKNWVYKEACKKKTTLVQK